MHGVQMVQIDEISPPELSLFPPLPHHCRRGATFPVPDQCSVLCSARRVVEPLYLCEKI